MTVGEKIRHYRTAKGLTQKELGRLSETAETTVRQYEGGKRTPRIEQIEKLAAALDVHPSALMGWGYWDAKNPESLQAWKDEETFESYLKTLGYLLSPEKIGESESGCWEEKTFIPDEEYWEIVVSKGEKSVTFTTDEFNELQNAIKDVIETRFYKKVLEAQRKK